MKKNTFLIFIVIASLFISSCSNVNSEPTRPNSSSKFEDLSNVSSSHDYITEIIDSIKILPTISSDVSYRSFKNESKELYRIGISGVPILIDKIEKSDEFSCNQMFWLEGIYSLLRIDKVYVMINYPENSSFDSFKAMLLDSRTEIPSIINSEETLELKIDKLRKYGLLSIPYLKEAVENYEKEYMSLFFSVGIHLKTDEWMEYLLYHTDEDWYKSEEYLATTDTFDYSKWLTENWNGLANTHNLINALVSEK